MDGLEDLFGGLGPYEWFWVLVPVGDPGADVAFEGVHVVVVAAFEELSGEFGEPAFDLLDTQHSRSGHNSENLRGGLNGAKIGRYWAGLVDMTPDGLPVIDSSAGPRGLTIITGLCGHGFTLGPVLGEIASDLSLDGATSRPIKEFRLSRYSDGDVGNPDMMI